MRTCTGVDFSPARAARYNLPMTFQGKTMRNRTRDEEEEDDDAPPARAALKRCPDCGRRISKRATACPECGRSMPGFSAGRVLVLLLLALIAWAVLVLRR